MKKFISGLLVGGMLMTSTTIFAETQMSINAVFGKVKLVVNNQAVEQETLVYNGTTYVPLRATAEILDKEVTYDNKTSTAYIDELGTGRTFTTTTTNANTSVDTEKILNDVALLEEANALMVEEFEYEGLFMDYFNLENYDLAGQYLALALEKTLEIEKLDLTSVSVELDNARVKYVKTAKQYINSFSNAIEYLEKNDYGNAGKELDEALVLYEKATDELTEYLNALNKYAESVGGDLE